MCGWGARSFLLYLHYGEFPFLEATSFPPVLPRPGPPCFMEILSPCWTVGREVYWPPVLIVPTPLSFLAFKAALVYNRPANSGASGKAQPHLLSALRPHAGHKLSCAHVRFLLLLRSPNSSSSLPTPNPTYRRGLLQVSPVACPALDAARPLTSSVPSLIGHDEKLPATRAQEQQKPPRQGCSLFLLQHRPHMLFVDPPPSLCPRRSRSDVALQSLSRLGRHL